MASNPGYDDESRSFVRDAVYLYLGAYRHLSEARINEIKSQAGRDKRLAEAKI
jgi:hypothetical protein